MAQFFLPVIDLEASGKRLEQLRKKNKLSVKDIQELLGLSAQAVSKWKTGKSIPSTDNLLALSVIFKVHMEDLLVYKDVELNTTSRETSRVFFFEIAITNQNERKVDFGLD